MAEVAEPVVDAPRLSLQDMLERLTRDHGPVIGGLGMFHMPQIYSLRPACWHQQTIADYETGKHCATAGWRGGAKSKLAQLYQLWKMLKLDWKISMHLCLSPDLVRQHSGDLRRELDTNKILQARFQIVPGKVQQEDYFQVKLGKSHQTQITFVWQTRDGEPRGLHPNGVLIDDVDDINDTPYMMQKHYDKIHSTVMGGLEAYAGVQPQIIVCGNYTGDYCSMVQFQKRDAVENPDSWIVRSYPALEDGRTIHLTGAALGTSTWPEKMSTEELLKRRAEMNVARAFWFEMEFQNLLVSVEQRIWSEEMFKNVWPALVPKAHAVYGVYIDSSQSVAETGDETAITTWGKVLSGPRLNEYMFVDARVAHLAPDTIASEVIRQYIGNGTPSNPQCDRVCLESKSKTKTGEDPLAALIRLKARQENVNLNVRQLVPSEDKRTRSLRAVPVGRSGAITVPAVLSPDMRKCINQMVMFTGKADRGLPAVDDGHDSCVWALIDLQPIARRDESAGRAIELKGRLRAVA